MKFIQSIVFVYIILMLILVESLNAQQNLAQQAYAIIEQSCIRCHGENGAYTEALIIDYRALIDDGKVVAGDPNGSVFYQRLIETNVAKRMPQGQPALDPAAIETIRQWIATGAPDWDANPSPLPSFITTEVLLEKIDSHINSLSPSDKSFARYFTLTHLYNAGETTEALNAYRRALSKLINSLSWGREIVKPKPIDAEQTVYYIDLRHYEWDVRNEAWTQIEQVYPYQMTYDAPTQTDLKEKLTLLQQETNSEVPFVNVDWFIATASLPPLYNNILSLPETANELEESLGVSVTQNLQNAPGIRVWRAGFNDSGVSRHNRVVERHTSSHGAYWKSYDFAGSADSQNIFTHPLDFTHDGGEIIFNLPNGLQAYFLVDGVGNRLDVAPTDIVSNPAASDPAVYNGLSCIGCHTEGMKTFEDEVRAVVEQADNPPYNKERALELYVQKTEMDKLVEGDTQRYRAALEAAGGVFGGIEPIQRFHEVFQSPLSPALAAAAVGLETDIFLERVSNNVSLQNLLGALVVDGGTIKRDAWTSSFHDVVSEINSPDTVLPPIEHRPERIPGASVHIPDPNLRAALEEALSKAAGDEITVEDMESLTEFQAEGLGIKDIVGLEYAINLRVLQIRGNMISDISLVSSLSNLSLLRIADNNISDISAIAGLTNISSLEIYANEITDISPLTGLTNVAWLSMYGNPVTDLSPLANLKRMDAMRVSVEEPGDLSPLAELTNLRVLYYWGSGNPVPDLKPLIDLPELITIDIRGVSTVDLSSLAKVETLERFEFWGTGENLPDLTPLAEAINLKELWVINCGITDLTILQNFTSLERLNLDTNNISDVSPLAALTNLKWLKLTNNPITDFSPISDLSQTTNIIAGSVNIPDRNLRAAIAEALGKDDSGVKSITFEEMATLTTLEAQGKEIQDLTGLQYATDLHALELVDNLISDLSPLGELKKLTILKLFNNPVSDLSPLTEMTQLRELTLSDHSNFDLGIIDLSPLAGLTNLTSLAINNIKVADLRPLSGLVNLEGIRLSSNGLHDLSPLTGLINLRDIHTWGNPFSDVSFLTRLTKLEQVDICGTENISDLSPLAGKTKLKQLYLVSCGISNVSGLAALAGLVGLDLRENNISDVSSLAGLTSLKWLNLTYNEILDFSPLEELAKSTVISRAFNPGVPIAGPKIEGPWLWVTVPRENENGTTDFLSEASDGAVTEQYIATKGAKEGNSVGDNEWISSRISPGAGTHGNIGNMLISQNMEAQRQTGVIYGVVMIGSQQETNAIMFAGSSAPLKVWLNGELVHEANAWRLGKNYQDFFPITLKRGANVLLVSVHMRKFGELDAYIGFEEETEYTVIQPGAGFSFFATETNLLAGDTFTLNLNAENINNLAGWQADITFDPNALEAVEVSEGDFLKSDENNTFFNAGTIDNVIGKITNLYSARIAETGVSGTGTLLSVTFKAKAGGETQVTLENFEFTSIAGDIIPAVPPNITITVGEYPAWDVNQDGRVSIQDLVLVARDFGSGTPANLRTDVNRDGVINIQDLIIVAQHIGESTDSAAVPIVVLDTNELTPATVQAWIRQAKIEDDGSAAFRQGIENLQKLLATLLPDKTVLLANYPNPFNPETWIPYQLAKPADVTLTIYATNGAVVRRLTLGHQTAGIYLNRNHAIHWDGRNDVGEAVASGIYFYTLTAGDFTSTRRMLIRK